MKLPIVHIRCLDHSHSDGDSIRLLPIDVFGVLLKEDKQAYYIASWLADGVVDQNAECFSILKHKGLKLKRVGFYTAGGGMR